MVLVDYQKIRSFFDKYEVSVKEHNRILVALQS